MICHCHCPGWCGAPGLNHHTDVPRITYTDGASPPHTHTPRALGHHPPQQPCELHVLLAPHLGWKDHGAEGLGSLGPQGWHAAQVGLEPFLRVHQALTKRQTGERGGWSWAAWLPWWVGEGEGEQVP